MTQQTVPTTEARRRRNRGPSAEQIGRLLKAAAAAGHPVSEIRHEPGGVVRLLLVSSAAEEKPVSQLNEWKLQREARKSVSRPV
jgi:hypothetical protein